MLKWRYGYILLISNGNDNHDAETWFQVVCHNSLNLGWLTDLFIMRVIENFPMNLF